MSEKYPGGFVSLGGPVSNSNYFGGSAYLSVASNAAFSLGSADFTIEAWVYKTASGNLGIWSNGPASAGSFSFYIISNKLQIDYYGGTSLTGATTLSSGVWYHLAATRSGSTFRLFVNGNLDASTTSSFTNTTGNCVVGLDWSGGTTYFNGYLSNVRLVKATALYTANFVPPTGPLQNVSGTTLLTCQSSTIIDNSSNAWSLTNTGGVSVNSNTPLQAYNPNTLNPALGAATPGVWTLNQAMNAKITRSWPMYDPYYNYVTMNLHGNSGVGGSFVSDASPNNYNCVVVADARPDTNSPFTTAVNFQNGSGYFDATGDYISVPSTSGGVLDLTTVSTFTVEAWVYVTSLASERPVFSTRPSATTAGWALRINANGTAQFYFTGGSSLTTSSTVSANTWTHVAVTRSGANVSIYINGVSGGSSSSWSNGTNTSNSLLLGASAEGTGVYYSGYISNARVVNGSVVYASNFTPSTTPLTAIVNTQLLTLQTPNPANNSGFLDSSTNNFAITRNGNTTQGSFSPYGSLWSIFNNSSSTYSSGIYLNGESDFAFGTGDFTIEMWINLYNISRLQVVYDSRPGSTQGVYPTIYYDTSVNKLKYYVNGADRITATSSFVFQKWHHVVVTRTGTSTKMFIDGVQEGSTYTDTNNYLNGTDRPFTGDGAAPDVVSNGAGMTGFMSNLRVVKGSGPYQGAGTNITVPTSPLTAVANTVLLTAQSNRFVDTNTQATPKLIRQYHVPTIDRYNPFLQNLSYTPTTLGGSAYFDGAGDVLTTSSSAISYAGDFCIECYFYTGTGLTYAALYSDENGTVGGTLLINNGSNNGQITFYCGSVSNFASTSTGLNNYAWHHVAVTRSGTTLRLFIDGKLENTTTVSGTPTTPSTFKIGNSYYASRDFGGYISSFRTVVGSPVYTAAFTPPTAPLTAIPNTQLLCNMTNAGIADNSMLSNLETIGNSQVSTVQKQYGTGSMYFDGSGDYLSTPTAQGYNFYLGDFTVEAWININRTAGNAALICGLWDDTGASQSWYFYVATTGKLEFVINTTVPSNITILSTSSTIPNNTWTHVAACRSGSNWYGFINGVLLATGSTALAIRTSTTDPFAVGSYPTATAAYALNGYIDDLRITKDIARYTANFTPPTSQLQDQ